LTGCSDSWEDKYTNVAFEAVSGVHLAVSPDTLVFSSQSSSQQLDISSNSRWTAQSSAGWLTLSSSSGKGNASLTVTAESNISSTQQRTATVTISNGVTTHAISVAQAGVQPPVVSPVTTSSISKHAATCTVSATSPDLDITEYGLCYSNQFDAPSQANADVVSQSGGGRSVTYDFKLSKLVSKSTYYVRPYIVTALGVTYGPTTQFITPPSVPEEGDNVTPVD